MRITFAREWTHPDTGRTHRPDSTAEVVDWLARRLLGDGWARRAPAKPQPTAEGGPELPPPGAEAKPARTTTPTAQSTESPATTGKHSTEKE